MTGVYDSGLGGLTVLKELIAQRGKRDYLYFADSKYCPYGLKSKDFLRERAAEVSRFLIDQGADMIVVACNTATAAAISHLRETFDIPFVGMEPAIKPAILNTRTGVVGVLATAVTFTGELYHKTLEHYTAGQGNIKVIEQVGYGLVEAVESGRIHDSETIKLMNPMNFIGNGKAVTAKHFRIRHGAIDRDTALAISAILALKLQNSGVDVNFYSPWNRGHAGDYDLPELFNWIDSICKA